MMTDLERKRLLYKIARAYYDDSLTQQQIADRFGLSRVKVSRLLREAREDKIIHDALATDPQVADTLELAARADVALVGIGAFESDSTLLSSGNTLTAKEIKELRAKGVQGDIALQFFDADGRRVDHPINDRIVGTDLERIKRIGRVIAVAGGAEKRSAIRAALRGRLIRVLVTDDQTAKWLLE
jgi:DNA-binding transcriptional regulator LsrR (DeoR family)